MRDVIKEGRVLIAKSPVPRQILRLDDIVSDLILQALQSDKGAGFFKHLKEAKLSLNRDPEHAEISYVFRSKYTPWRCRELWRFTLAKNSDIQFSTSMEGFKPVCPQCSTTQGYPLPRQDEAGKRVHSGSMYTEQIISEEFKQYDRMLVADIMQMRANGDFDEAMRLTVDTLKELRLTMLDYEVFYVSIHRRTDGRVAICPGYMINTMMPGLQEEYSVAIRYSRSYFKPCDHCKGAGCVDPDAHSEEGGPGGKSIP